VADLSRKRERERLPVRPDPYWQRLAEGAYLGFRRGPNTWLARFRGRDGRQQYQPLGETMEFDEAKRKAEEWLSQIAGTSVRSVTRATVKAALDAYLTDLRRHGRATAAKAAEGMFATTINKDALAGRALEMVTRDDFEEWRDRLTDGRLPRSVNRYVRQVMAALNRGVELGHVGNPAAWRLKPLQDDVEADRETAVFLTPEQRKSLVAAANAPAAAFFRGLELTGARPSELAAATVRDFDGESLRLKDRKGSGSKVRIRHTVLSAEGVKFFTAQTVDKLPASPIFTEDGTTPWRRHEWAHEMREAAKAVNKEARGKARIPPGVGAYAFRHARISELLQIHGVDPLTVAQQTGTGLVMIERQYLKFIPHAMKAKLAGVREA
jgi:integrase